MNYNELLSVSVLKLLNLQSNTTGGIMFFLPLICLLPLLTLCSTSWAPLTPADYLLASTLDPRVDHVDLFPGTGGPRQGGYWPSTNMQMAKN